MKLASQLIKGSAFIGSAELLSNLFSLLRNLLVARILPPEHFGLAVSVGLIATLIEVASRLSVGGFLTQSKDGGTHDALSNAHLIQFASGAIAFLLITLLSGPTIKLIDLPIAPVAMSALALVPLCNGLMHLGPAQHEKRLHFLPSAICSTVPQLITTLAIFPALNLLPDYRAVISLTILRAAVTTLTSHIIADTPYRWQLNRSWFVRLWHFSWPITLNSIMLMIVMQGEQVASISFLPPADIAYLATATSIAIAPSLLAAKVFMGVMFPLLASSQECPVTFLRAYRFLIQGTCAISAAYTLLFVMGAEHVMQTLYGGSYAGTGPILAWIAAANAIRIVRMGLGCATLSRGDSKNQLFSNCWRLASFPCTIIAATAGCPLWLVAATALPGEILALTYSVLHLSRRHSLPPGESLRPIIVATVTLTASGITAWTLNGNPNDTVTVLTILLVALSLAAIILTTFHDLRYHLFSLLRKGPRVLHGKLRSST